jgi:uncharacterized peroxidase-related enzyme
MFLPQPEASEAGLRIRQSSRDTHGFVMNVAQLWSWRPDLFEAFAALRNQLTSQSALTKRDQAVIVCATASQLGDSYCSLAWGTTLAAEATSAVAAAVLAANDADGVLTPRDVALIAWVRKVVADPNGTTRSDVDALKAAGFGDREIFEVTAFTAFRVAFSAVNDALGATPDWQLFETVPKDVVSAVSYGRAPELPSST